MAALAEFDPGLTVKPSIFSGINMKLLYWAMAFAAAPTLLVGAACIYLTRQAIGGAAGADSIFSQVLAIDLVGLALSVVFILAAAWLAGRSVTKPVAETAGVVFRIGSGDLSEQADRRFRNDELGVLNRSINELLEYIREMAAVADRLAGGDMAASVQPRSDGDLLGQALQRMIDNRRRIAADLARNAKAVADAATALYRASEQARAAASQIAESMEGVSKDTADASERIARIAAGAEQQRAEVLSSSETINQMTSAIERVAQNAEVVAEASDSAYKAAAEGGDTVKQAVASMNSIRETVLQSASQLRQMGGTSKQIAGISDFIADIAEQTGILAINAAIEASRAGEQGKGFAVVADEVRKLAARSATATSQISELTAKMSIETQQAIEAMEQGVARVEDGAALAGRAADALQSILAAVRRKRPDSIDFGRRGTDDHVQRPGGSGYQPHISSGGPEQPGDRTDEPDESL